MRGVGARIRANVAYLLLLGTVLAVGAVVRWAGPAAFGDEYRLIVAVPDGGGIQVGMPVTVLGAQVGLVVGTTVTREAVDLELEFDAGQPVPRDTVVQVLRRSPIGEQAVELTPVEPDWEPSGEVVPSRLPVDADWEAIEPGSRLRPLAVVVPSSVPRLLERAERLLAAIPGPELRILVEELGTAVDGRVETLRTLNRDVADLTGTLVTAIPDTERLLDASRDVLGVLAEHREELAAAVTDTADVVETLAASRPDVEHTLTGAVPTLRILDDLIRDQRANLVCLDRDLLALGELVASDDDLTYLARMLDLNRYFYGGFDAATQWDPFRPGLLWARVNILIDQSPAGQPKVPLTPTPATRPGAACTSPFGPGVQAVRQTDPPPVPPDPTSPGIEYAPAVAGADPGTHDGVPQQRTASVTTAPAPLPAVPAAPGGATMAAEAARRTPMRPAAATVLPGGALSALLAAVLGLALARPRR